MSKQHLIYIFDDHPIWTRYNELDTLQVEARLPLYKTEKCRTLISIFLKRKKVTFGSNPFAILHARVNQQNGSLTPAIFLDDFNGRSFFDDAWHNPLSLYL